MDIWVVSTFLDIIYNATTNIQVFVWMYVFIFLGAIPRGRIAGHMVTLMLNVLRNCLTVFQSSCII